MIKSPPKDLRIEVEKLTGFYRGVVEDNDDPLKAGRIRIRIHGLHTEKTIKSELEGIPTEELPWAEPCMPIQEGSVSGFGAWSVPLQGSHVMVFFENSNPLQPRYFASMPGIPESKESYSNNDRSSSKDNGFKDPDGEYPTNVRLNEPDVHRLARGISEGTLVETKNENLDIGVSTALGGSWNEPESAYNAKYPHNYVITTHGGITIELDSTPGSARLHVYHPSNSYIEIDNEGNMVVRNGGEKYEIVLQSKNVHIRQDHNISVEGHQKKKVSGDEQQEIVGSKQEEIGDNKIQNIGGNKEEDIGGNKEEDIGGNKEEDIGGNLTITVTGDTNLTSPQINLNGPVKIGGFLSVDGDGAGEGGEIEGTIRISGGDIIITGGNVEVSGGDVEADGISLKNHVHGGVESGGSFTDTPS